MDYAYANARIKAMKSQMLKAQDFDALIKKPDLDSFITELEKTPYKKDLEKAGIRFTGIYKVEEALRKSLITSFQKLLRILEKEDEEEDLLRLILERWDVQNIKTILRGKRIYATPEEILSCLVPAGDLDEATLVELTRQNDVKAVIDLLATWGIKYYRPLIQHYKEYTEKRDMTILEYAIDIFYFENALQTVKRGESDDASIVRDIITMEIDLINIKTVLKVIRDKEEPEIGEQFLIRGSKALSVEALRAMMKAGTIKASVQQLLPTNYRFLSDVPEKFLADEKISELEKELDQYLVKKGISHFLGDPLSIAIGIGYVWAKVTEVTNIRIIAWGKTTDVSERELQEALIHV